MGSEQPQQAFSETRAQEGSYFEHLDGTLGLALEAVAPILFLFLLLSNVKRFRRQRAATVDLSSNG